MTDYVMVPTVPTTEMLEAAQRVIVDDGHTCNMSGYEAIYRVMLSAAPQAIAPEGRVSVHNGAWSDTMLVVQVIADGGAAKLALAKYGFKTDEAWGQALVSEIERLLAAQSAMSEELRLTVENEQEAIVRAEAAESLLRAGERDGERYRWCLQNPNAACLIFAEATNPDTFGYLRAGAVPMKTAEAYIQVTVDEAIPLDSAMERKK